MISGAGGHLREYIVMMLSDRLDCLSSIILSLEVDHYLIRNHV